METSGPSKTSNPPTARPRGSWAALLTLATALAPLGCGGAGSGPPEAGEGVMGTRTVSVAAASDLKFAMQDLIAGFREAHPEIRVSPTFGSSGNFFAQISGGAPFDVFFSADVDYPRRLADQKLADANEIFTYAEGHLVAWIPGGSPLDLGSQGIEMLAGPSVRKVAIANPRHAPYGRAAEAALKGLGIYEAVREKLVLGENVAQAAQYVESGAADAGLIARSLSVSPPMRGKGRAWPIPEGSHPPLLQAGVILSKAADPGASRMFRDFVTGGRGREILARHGLSAPGG